MSKKLIVDVATIYPGKGGAGGGIWNYTKNLLLYLDAHSNVNEVNCICLVNKQFNLSLKNIAVKRVPFDPDNFFFRFLYVHLYLPLYILLNRASLHKVYFEVPFWMPFNTVVTIHDLMGRFYKTKVYGRFAKSQPIKSFYFDLVQTKAIKKSKKICTPTQFIKQELIDNYKIPAEKVIVTPLAAGKFNKVPGRLKDKKQGVHIYCIAAFHPHKGHLRLIEIFETLCANNLDGELYLRGHVHDKKFFRLIETKIETSKFKDRIHILNYDANLSLEEIYSKADWVILLSEYEGFGLPVIEAQANGIPVICSSIPTFKEAAAQSVFYIDNGVAIEEAAKLLLQLLSCPDQRNYFIEKGFENAKRYSWEKLSDQMIALYKTLN